MTELKEVWKDIKGFESLYQISNMGKVKSLDRQCWNGFNYFTKQGRMLKIQTDKDGYSVIGLHKDVKSFNYKIHRLVAIAFIPNPLNLPEVNHKRGNKKDNKSTSLEWCTQKENINHAIRTGLKTFKRGKDNPLYGKYTGDKNPMFGITGEKNSQSKRVKCVTIGKKFGSMGEASREYKVNQGDISRCCNGKRSYAGKHPTTGEKLVWEYI